ncbi:MAG: hypothetical protein HQL85_08920 [Magnetococcales bacterium]|nr:hypothetical protein [Magnetococcales bacterium]MBF0172432.1 hypothetical protein [Magnetococcales bacterium]MBF0631392.1 hypothetical protein [Magnetococcales bacterium]
MIILVVMTATIGLIAYLYDHLLYLETVAVEQSLARVRIYWAMVGKGNYFLSRLKWRIYELDEESSPQFSAVQIALGTFAFDQLTPSDCATSTEAAMIIRCIWDEVAPYSSQNILVWDYGPGYRLPIQVSKGGNVGKVLISLAQGAVSDNGPVLQSRLIAGNGLQMSFALDGVNGQSASVRFTEFQE